MAGTSNQGPGVGNVFTGAEVAARYRRVRPEFHDEVADRIRAFAGVEGFERALDVGCGAGQSSVAMAGIARSVLGVDLSQDMIDHAAAHPRVHYALGLAEDLAVDGGPFDLITVGCAMHWFIQDRFFAGCRRLLAPHGILAVYNDHFTAHMRDDVACKRWMRTRYIKRFRPSRRRLRDMDEAMASRCGFEIGSRDAFEHFVPFTRSQFIDYLFTRSNVLARIQSGVESEAEARAWMEQELEAIVPEEMPSEFVFKCNLWLLRHERMES